MEQLSLELAPPPAATFENFFPARNAATVAQLRAAARGEERFLYLWGPRGSGKTHLLRAFAAAGAGRGAVYAAPGQPLPAAATVLACDDVHLLDLVGQLALFDLFNRLRGSGGTLLTAGDRPPPELPLRDDLRSRLGAGVVVRAEALSDEEKSAALAEHAGRRGLRLEPQWLDYIQSRAQRDMGTQMAIIDTLDRLSLQRKRAVTLPLLREVLQLVEPGRQ
jgi:DnaA-homolog protein